MNALIRHHRLDTDDYRMLADDAPVPAAGKLIVTLDRWQKNRATLSAPGLAVGVSVPNTVDITTVIDTLRNRPLIALQFPAFGDGRAYSQARLLRDRDHYTGEIRAVGTAVVLDQLAGMARCGFTSFLLRADQKPDACLAALKGYGLAYQPADAATPVVPRLRARPPHALRRP